MELENTSYKEIPHCPDVMVSKDGKILTKNRQRLSVFRRRHDIPNGLVFQYDGKKYCVKKAIFAAWAHPTDRCIYLYDTEKGLHIDNMYITLPRAEQPPQLRQNRYKSLFRSEAERQRCIQIEDKAVFYESKNSVQDSSKDYITMHITKNIISGEDAFERAAKSFKKLKASRRKEGAWKK